MKKSIISIVAVLLTTWVFGQTYDLQFVEVGNDKVNGGNYDVKIQIKASGSSFDLGVANLAFAYNTDGLISQHAPDDGSSAPVLLTAHNFNSGGYDAMSLTEPQRGVLSVNINYAFESSGNGENIATTGWMDVATVRFVIRENTALAGLTWQDDQSAGGVNPVAIFNDDAPAQSVVRGSVSGYNNPLPVEFTDFSVSKQGPVAVLNWGTAMEFNNEGFVVLRSNDQVNWVELAFIEGAGNTSAPSRYTYSDNNPFAEGTEAYYRLKQKDFDGTVSYSVIRSVIGEDVLDFQVSTYPNPFMSQIHVESNCSDALAITLLSMEGTELTRSTDGTGTLHLLDHLDGGMYMLKVQCATSTEIVRVVKQQ